MSGFLHNLARRTEPVMDLRPRLLSRFEADQGAVDQADGEPESPAELPSVPTVPVLSFDQPRTSVAPTEQVAPEPNASVTNVHQHFTSIHQTEQIHSDNAPKIAVPTADSHAVERLNAVERQVSTLVQQPSVPDVATKTERPAAPQSTTELNREQPQAAAAEPAFIGTESLNATTPPVPEVRVPEPAPAQIHRDDALPTRQPQQIPVVPEPDRRQEKRADVVRNVPVPEDRVAAEQTPQIDADGIAQRLLKKLRRAVSPTSTAGRIDGTRPPTPVQSLQPEKAPAIRAAMTPQKTINVSIGRVEVRAASSAKVATPAPAAASAPASKVMSLDEYIARRSSGGMA